LRAATPNTPLNQTNRNGLSSTSRFDRKDTFSSTNLRTSQSSTASNSKPPTTPSLRSFSPSLKRNRFFFELIIQFSISSTINKERIAISTSISKA